MHQLSTAGMTPEQQFSDLLAADPSRPFVTYYDEAGGERSELSVKSLANWVAKTHHLLTTELGLGVGDTALVAVPAHWISVPVLLGCLTAGLAITPSGPADVAFVAPETMAEAEGIADVYAVAPASAAVGFGGRPPAPAADYVSSVRPQEDKWWSVHLAATADDPCLPGLTRGEVAARAANGRLAAGARLLTTRPWATPEDWIDAVLAPAAVRGSLVIVANCTDEDLLAKRMGQERATVRLS
jgi:uncharacterized protein (TIGR03089 family)